MNAPSACVVVAIFSPVARLSSVTVAPGTTAPLVSRAVPTMRPRVVCADAGPAADATKMERNSSRREARALMDDPPNDDQGFLQLRGGWSQESRKSADGMSPGTGRRPPALKWSWQMVVGR